MGIDLHVHTVGREHEHPEQLKKGDAGDATSDAHGLRDDRIHIRAGVSVPAQSQKPPAPHQGGQLAPPQPAERRSARVKTVESKTSVAHWGPKWAITSRRMPGATRRDGE